MIAVIVPTARPKMAANVLANFERQRWPGEGVVLVVAENGPGLDAWGSRRGHIVQSAHGKAHARTAGLRYARELGAKWFAFWDDDDHYAAGWLEFMWANRDRADLIGMCEHVVESPTGERYLARHRPPGLREPTPAGFVDGLASSALFGRVDRALDWTAHVDFSAEIFWYTDMHEAGRTLCGVAEPNPADPLFVLKRYADPDHGHAVPGGWAYEVKSAGDSLSPL